jgi:cation diffusion facilitator CzcD-associated flavoprotein CzcO
MKHYIFRGGFTMSVYDVVIIGGGMCGLQAAKEAASLEAGKIVLIEKDDNLGGT